MARILALALVSTIMAFLPGAGAAESRPNIIVIMADDMGFSDLGCYGGEIETPHLDWLAEQGLRFSQFYNCALCGPSRAALMTGLHPHQVGISRWTGLLNDRCTTAFELLKQSGYATCAVGRLDMVTAENWHEPENIGRYVDRYFGTTGHLGPGSYFKDVSNSEFYRDGQPYSIPDGGYKTDLIADFAVEFIEGRDRERPFFLYMAHYAPHWPLHARPEDIAKYRDRYRELGWDTARDRRLRRLIERGVLPAGTEVCAPRDPRAVAWTEAEHLDWEAERMATYAAQIDRLDQTVGRVMTALRDSAAENTLVFFLSDNGSSDTAVNQVDKPGQIWRRDGTPTRAGNVPTNWPGSAETFVTAGPAWASVSNTPFRLHKNSNHEGGISSPLIAWWPSVIQPSGGVSHELSHITDILATCLEVAGQEYPGAATRPNVLPLAGKSLLPVLRGGDRHGHDSLCWATSGCKAVRVGTWKLVALPKKSWELYDLSRDRAELHDLASREPERVRSMEAIFDEWWRSE